MRFLLDESVDVRLGVYLKSLGHDVTAVAQDHAASIRDTSVLEIALEESRILITNDRDFGDLIFRQSLPHSEVIYLRFRTRHLSILESRITEVISRYADRLTEFIVVTEHMTRVRS